MVRFKHISSWFVLCTMCMSGASGAWAWNSLQSGGRCKQTNISCRSTIGNAGGAGSCCDPRQSNILTCETQNECQGGSPHKWKTLPYQWQLNLNNMAGQSGYQGISASQIESATKLAHDAWTKPTCTGFTHKYNGQTSSRASTGDRKNIVFLASPSNWAQMGLPSAALAVTRPIASGSTLYDTDIVVNPVPGGRPWGITPNVGRSNMDYADVMAHEVGHALGFGHAGPKSSLMYFSIRGVGPVFSGLSSDEEAGVCTIYPVTKCSSDAQCGGGCRVCTNGTCQQKTVSPATSACKGCTTDAQCGSGAQCVSVGGQMRCLTTCATGDCCPSGNTCKSLSGKRVCAPDSGACPALSCSNNTQCGAGEICAGGTCQKACQNDSECPTGSGCRNNVCTQLAPGKLGQPCSSQLPCESGLSCFQTSKGQLCSRECGSSSSAGFPAGQQGAQCNGSSCDNGASCVGFRSSTGTTQVCITRCTSSTVCNNVGGKCFRLSGSNFAGCFCQSDSDCKSGQSCNKTVLGPLGLGLGACGTPAATTCPSGYACTPVS
ncbi:MAG TPA: hypothetical protein DCE42_27005, partial [Myxococcales bacterium]|nr:hypothetical protein [Myxococcales bacterium]